MGNTDRSSAHFVCRKVAGFGGARVLSVEVVLFTAVSPTRRAPVRTGRPPPCVLRDTARQSLSHPPCPRSDLVQSLRGHQTQAASSREKSHVPSPRIPRRSLPAIVCSPPAAR